jgi:hypothetical protein
MPNSIASISRESVNNNAPSFYYKIYQKELKRAILHQTKRACPKEQALHI